MSARSRAISAESGSACRAECSNRGWTPPFETAFSARSTSSTPKAPSSIDIELPHAPYAIATYYVVATAEASSNLARYDGVRYGFRAEGARDLREMYEKTRSQGFGPEVKRRIMLGTYVLSAGYYDAYYLKAQQVRTLVRARLRAGVRNRRRGSHADESRQPAFKIGEKIEDPLSLYLTDVFTVSANLAGLPGLSVPCGLTPDRLPIGLQLTGRPFDEATLLKIGDCYERDTNWWKECPRRREVLRALLARSSSSGVFSTSIGPRGASGVIYRTNASCPTVSSRLLTTIDPVCGAQLRKTEDDAETQKQHQDEHRAGAECQKESNDQVDDFLGRSPFDL